MQTVALAFLFYYLAVLAVFCLYGLHRWWLVWDLMRTGGHRPDPPCPEAPADWPSVTVQLPMYNEGAVAERIILAAVALDYPSDRLQIQVLDDASDGSADATRRLCARLREAGHDIDHRHRDDRTGYKAGALAAGLETARGTFVALFDADFIPPADFLRRTVPYFKDQAIGLVQTRWTHLNREDSPLTAVQAMALDAHFLVEHTARCRRGRWFNFNGTAGIWRRRAIDDAGGWAHDTLTEDTDLSYRSQMAGWRFLALNDVTCPAELPPSLDAFAGQQHRWNKGLIENALKLWPTIRRAPVPLATRLDAWFHLTAPVPYVAMLILTILTVPVVLVGMPVTGIDGRIALGLGLLCLALGTGGAGAYVLAAARGAGQPVGATLARLPLLMAIGVGISARATGGVIEAIFGRRTAFIRTPKYADGTVGAVDPARRRRTLPSGWVETTLGLVQVAAIVGTVQGYGSIVGLPFLILFGVGYLSVGLPMLRQSLRPVRRPARLARA